MAISYPVTLPATPGFIRFEPKRKTTVGITMSEFTNHQQTTEWPADLVEIEVSLPPMARALAMPWVGALSSLYGAGTFYLGPRGAERTPRGTSTVASINGSQAAGLKTVAVTLNGTLKAGDWIQIGTRLHQVLVDLGGTGNVEIYPRLRAAVAGSASITLTNPVGLFRLRGEFEHSTDRANVHYIGFSAMEAL